MAGSKLKNDDQPVVAKKAPRAATAKVGGAVKMSAPADQLSDEAVAAKPVADKPSTGKAGSKPGSAVKADETRVAGAKVKPAGDKPAEAGPARARDGASSLRTVPMDEARVAALKAGAANIAAMRGAARKSAARVPVAATATTAAVAPKPAPVPAPAPVAAHLVPPAPPRVEPVPVVAAGAPKPKPATPAPKGQGFKTGEFIVYPAHGVGQITAVEEQVVAGYKLELFVISFIKDKMILKVPLPKILSVGMRKLADPAVVKRALDTLTGRARIKRTMWSRRAQEYEAKINSGDLIAISEVVRDLYRSDAQPEQSYSERQLYEAALDRIARELSVVEKLTDSEALKLIDGQLQKGPRRGKPDEADAAAEEADEEEGGIGEAA